MDLEMSSSLQENTLALLVFNSDWCPIICNSVKPDLFGSREFRIIATRAIDFYFRYKEPARDHIADLMEKELEGEDGEIYDKTLKFLFELKESINADFASQTLKNFLKQRNISQASLLAYEAAQRGDLDGADRILDGIKEKNIELFDPGLRFGEDINRTFRFLERENTDKFYLGVPVLDLVGCCAARKKILIVLAEPGTGKSWQLLSMAREAIKRKQKVLYLTLELSEDDVSERLCQMLFAASRSEAELISRYYKIGQDEYLGVDSLELEKISEKDVWFMDREKDIEEIKGKMKKYSKRLRGLVIKEFSRGTLKDRNVEAFIDSLYRMYGFLADLVLLDYPELMDLSADNYRITLGRTLVNLAGMTSERNQGLALPYQGNREGANKRVLWLDETHLSEDFSPFKHADRMISYNSTMMEKDLGLMRLFNFKTRHGKDGYRALITNNLSIGQFCLSSAFIHSEKRYMENFEKHFGSALIERNNKNGRNSKGKEN